MFTVEDILAGTGGHLVAGDRSARFDSVCIDSRAGPQGALFVAFRGQAADGHNFVTEALACGAAGALVERLPADEPWSRSEGSGPPIVLVPATRPALQDLAAYWRGKHPVRVIGVTGSVGKTTTKEAIADLLAQDATVLRTPANLNTEIGVPLSLMNLSPAHDFAVVEMAMYDVGDVRRLAHIASPEVGVITNVQPSHLERLGSIERIAEAKSELAQELPSDGLALLNADDERVRAMAAATSAPTLLYGLRADADIWADDIRCLGLQGIEFTAHYPARERQPLRVRTPLLGAHLVPAALVAIAVGVYVGMDFERAVAGLTRLGPALRLVVAGGIRDSTVLDDSYNANPASMIAGLNFLAELNGRHVAVLGDMMELGSYEEEGHRLVGQRAAGVAQWLLTVGPRAQAIAEAARAAGMDAAAVERFDRNDQVISRLQDSLQPGDTVLIKGSRAMRLDEVARAISTRSS